MSDHSAQGNRSYEDVSTPKEEKMPTLLSQPRGTFWKLLVAGLIGSVIATVVNLIIYFALQSVNGGPLIVQAAPLTLVSVLVSNLLPGPVAGILYWVLGRFTPTPTRWFLIVSVVVFGLAMVAPLLFMATSGTLAVWTLELMHVGAAIPIVGTIFKGRGTTKLPVSI